MQGIMYGLSIMVSNTPFSSLLQHIYLANGDEYVVILNYNDLCKFVEKKIMLITRGGSGTIVTKCPWQSGD